MCSKVFLYLNAYLVAWVSWAWICWTRVTSWFVGRFVLLGVSFVFHISDVSAVVVGLVVDDLSAAVRKESAVGAGDVSITICGLLMGVVVVRWLVLYSPGEVVWHRGLTALQIQRYLK